MEVIEESNKATTAAEGYASDGFETASESDVITDENDHPTSKDEQISPNHDQSVPVTAANQQQQEENHHHPYHDSLTKQVLLPINFFRLFAFSSLSFYFCMLIFLITTNKNLNSHL